MKPMRLWNELSLDVLDEIELDPKNVRLGYPTETPQDEIIFDLFKNENALELVESISRVGLLEHEVPIVLKRDEKMIVVEGNRRIAALKAIQNPLLVPEFKARIQAMVSEIGDRKALRTITVKEAPSQDDADQLIAALHTGKPRRPWTAPRRAEFFQAKVDDGKTLVELEREYPTIEVREYVRTAQLMRLFRSAAFSDPTLADFLSLRRFPVSVFARLYENEKFLELARINVDPKTLVATAAPPHDRFSALIERVVADIKGKVITTRKLNSYESATYVTYFEKLKDLASTFVDEVADDEEGGPVPAPTDQAETESEHADSYGGGSDNDAERATDPEVDTTVSESDRRHDHDGATANDNEPEPTTPESAADRTDTNSKTSETVDEIPKSSAEVHTPPLSNTAVLDGANKAPEKKKSRRQSINLNMAGIEVPQGYPPAMHQTYEELRNINIRNFPNATMDMLRTVLEKTIKAYAESKNETIKGWFGKTGKPVPRYEQLGDCLLYLRADLDATGKTGLVQVLQKITSNKPDSWTVSATHLNAMNHNHHISATSNDVEEMWNQMTSLIRHMMTP